MSTLAGLSTTARRLVSLGAVAVLLGVGMGAASTPAQAATTAASKSSAVKKTKTTASSALKKLKTKGRSPLTNYSRSQYGPAWQDVNRNGCDTRNDILKRDLTQRKYRARTKGCVVLSGTLKSAYTGERIAFKRGVSTSMEVQIDHVVAMANSWQTGAQQWTASKRLSFANDPLNLQAVDGKSNQQKGAGDAATWLPKNKSYRCTYVARQISVKVKYGLWVTAAERKAMERILTACPTQRTYKSTLKVDGGKATPPPSTGKPSSAKPVNGECPASAPIKGNQGSADWIYHVPGSRYYKVTKAEACFATTAAAEKAGYRAPRG